MRLQDYPVLMRRLYELSEEERVSRLRYLCRTDLYFLLRYAMGREDMEHPWLFDRCKEVELNPDGHLDLWSREHYKSTIITFGKTIQDILASHGNDPLPYWNGREVTVGIFSHTRPIAKAFLRQIMYELERNEFLRYLFPEVIWAKPSQEAPKWSEDGGLVVNRKSNPKEATVEAWGLVDGQPTSKHFLLLVYDDVVTVDSVRSPEMIAKTTQALELSYNLGVTDGGLRRFIGTRYHFNDTYREILKRGTAIPRLYPATADGRLDGEPVFWNKDQLRQKVRDYGPYTAACHGAGTKVLMADWTEKPIEEVAVDDAVMGYEFGDGRTKLVPTQVVATNHRCAETVRYTLESGHKGICTPDHQWFTGRSGNDSHKPYAALGFGRTNELSHLCRFVPDVGEPTREQQRAADYLAGIYDGEGTCGRSGSISISQSERHHPDVCGRIRWALRALDMEWEEHRRKEKPDQINFLINGGREGKYKLLKWGDPAKRDQITRSMFGARAGARKGRDRLVALEPAGHRQVFNIQTGTGNYIAGGYASKNCQLMQDPKADEQQGFRRDWLKFYRDVGEAKEMNRYLLVDPASEKKKTSDFTAMAVVGLGPDGNYYLLDFVRDRLNLKQRADLIFRLHRKWQPKAVGYEKYGKDSDIEHIEYVMEQENYRFTITPLGGQMAKNDRIKRLIPIFADGRFFLPDAIHRTLYDGTTVDVIDMLINEEYDPFPVPVHDDGLDVISRIEDPDLNKIWPKDANQYERQAKHRRRPPSAFVR